MKTFALAALPAFAQADEPQLPKGLMAVLELQDSWIVCRELASASVDEYNRKLK